MENGRYREGKTNVNRRTVRRDQKSDLYSGRQRSLDCSQLVRVHMNVVSRSTMNTNGGTEN